MLFAAFAYKIPLPVYDIYQAGGGKLRYHISPFPQKQKGVLRVGGKATSLVGVILPGICTYCRFSGPGSNRCQQGFLYAIKNLSRISSLLLLPPLYWFLQKMAALCRGFGAPDTTSNQGFVCKYAQF